MKTTTPLAVLDEHPDWLNPLYQEFTRRGVNYMKIDISASEYNPQDTNILPFYVNRLSPSAGKRGHETAFNYALNYIQYLELMGARVINGSRTVLLETSKAYQAALLKKLQIPHPKTMVFNTLALIPSAIDQFTFPVVIKPSRGGSGMGIQRFDSKQQLLDAVSNNNLSLPEEKLILLQEFIQPKDGHIVRVETINGKVVYAMNVYTEGTFNLCPSDSCDLTRSSSGPSTELGYCVASPQNSVRFELNVSLPQSVVTAIELLVKEAGLEIAGIEYVVDIHNDWYIYDINALSILRSSFKEEYGIDGWGMLADFLQAEYNKLMVVTGQK